MNHSNTSISLIVIPFKNIILLLCLLLSMASCNDCDCPENKNAPPKTSVKDSNLVTLSDLIFTDFGRCLIDSGKTEMIWYSTYPVVEDEEVDGKPPVKREKDAGKKIHARLTDPNEIGKFIGALPVLSERPNYITTVKDASYSYLIFVCNKDTLVEFSWDLGEQQVNVNNRWWFKFDFAKLHRQLDKIKTNKEPNH